MLHCARDLMLEVTISKYFFKERSQSLLAVLNWGFDVTPSATATVGGRDVT
jgi:hypothetical protein